MTEQPIVPERITKPIQILGAWLAGLLAIDSCFLIAAAKMPADSWEAKALVIAAVVNVPLFLIAVFLLQTRFRPELQEDSFYSSYLSRKTNEVVSVSKNDAQWAELQSRFIALESRLLQSAQPAPAAAAAAASKLEGVAFGINSFFTDRESIASKLAEQGVLGYSLFSGIDEPEKKIVAISKFLPQDVRSEVIALARDLKFEGYSTWDPSEDGNEEQVLIGSYGEASFTFTKSAVDPASG